jgi:hypothetical protein
MNLTLSAKQWVAVGIVLMTQSTRIVHSQVIAFASMPTKQHASIGQEMKLKNVLLDLQRHYGVEIIFEDRLVGSVNVASSNLDFNQPIEKNLDMLLRQNGLKYKKTRKNTFVITEGKAKEATPVRESKDEAMALPEGQMIQENLTEPALTQAAVDRTVKGIVADEAGAALPGVSVVLKGTQRGTSTGASGDFSLDIPDGGQPVLVFSFVGYKSQEVAVGNQSALNVKLAPDENALEEVVVVGYGTVKKIRPYRCRRYDQGRCVAGTPGFFFEPGTFGPHYRGERVVQLGPPGWPRQHTYSRSQLYQCFQQSALCDRWCDPECRRAGQR